MSVKKVILTGVRWLLGTPRFVTRLVTVETARALLSKLTPATKPEPGTKQLLADVSVISRNDAGTGIQRVVRELLRQLIANPPPGYIVRPVHATHWRGFRYADQYYEKLTGQKAAFPTSGKVAVRAGDIFLGMDLAAHTLPLYPFSHTRWKASGVKFFFIVYDLLPVLHPEWFTSSAVNAYREWIRTVAVFADGAICISQSVADELNKWLLDTYGHTVSESLVASWIHLGSNFSTDSNPVVRSALPGVLQRRIGNRPTILMVGTIEPRKGYNQVLSAFELLWQENHPANLVIVGKAGWKVENLVAKMRIHPEANGRLIWLETVTDEMLHALYQVAAGLVMASEGEGFGLPIVEVAGHGKPVLVRNLPVFREIAGSSASYFTDDSAPELAKSLKAWLGSVDDGSAPRLANIAHLTWKESANQLVQRLLNSPGHRQ